MLNVAHEDSNLNAILCLNCMENVALKKVIDLHSAKEMEEERNCTAKRDFVFRVIC
ncbi:hypothetical protein GCM10007931_29350 [Vibrio algivorus]|uniref:Uncharacterized protein n=1 Tax=Vibrio algivorus TaxID=1667024 RepID=A0ABQ6ETM2_9VIBR|nr:hypothetical protein GCM10007931_29350 [Vibrio algivorus]